MRCRRVRASTAEAETAVLSLQGDLIKVRQSYAEVVPSHLAGPDCRQLSFSGEVLATQRRLQTPEGLPCGQLLRLKSSAITGAS